MSTIGASQTKCLPERLHAVPYVYRNGFTPFLTSGERLITLQHLKACATVQIPLTHVVSRGYTMSGPDAAQPGVRSWDALVRKRDGARSGLTETTQVTALHRGTKKRSNGYRNEG